MKQFSAPARPISVELTINILANRFGLPVAVIEVPFARLLPDFILPSPETVRIKKLFRWVISSLKGCLLHGSSAWSLHWHVEWGVVTQSWYRVPSFWISSLCATESLNKRLFSDLAVWIRRRLRHKQLALWKKLSRLHRRLRQLGYTGCIAAVGFETSAVSCNSRRVRRYSCACSTWSSTFAKVRLKVFTSENPTVLLVPSVKPLQPARRRTLPLTKRTNACVWMSTRSGYSPDMDLPSWTASSDIRQSDRRCHLVY